MGSPHIEFTQPLEKIKPLVTAGQFQLVYGNNKVRGKRSLIVEADNIIDAVTKVLGGCDSIVDCQYRVGRLYGYVERIDPPRNIPASRLPKFIWSPA